MAPSLLTNHLKKLMHFKSCHYQEFSFHLSNSFLIIIIIIIIIAPFETEQSHLISTKKVNVADLWDQLQFAFDATNVSITIYSGARPLGVIAVDLSLYRREPKAHS